MPNFSITIFEFALLVHRKNVGLTVLFPADGHSLWLTDGKGTSRPIANGSEIVLCDPAGNPVPLQATPVTNKNTYVVDLEAVTPSPVAVPVSTLSGAIDPQRLNARVILAGGSLTEQPCFVDPGKVWIFNGQTRPVTDTAVFTHSINANEQYALVINKTAAVPISAGDTLELANRDDLGAPPHDFIELDEYLALCALAGAAPKMTIADPTRKPVTRSVLPWGAKVAFEPPKPGESNVCGIASIDSAI